MTIKAMEWAMRQTGISSSAKLVLMTLADCINSKDECAFPPQSRISEVVGLSVRQVRRLLRDLIEAGKVEVIPGAGAGRGRQPDRYFLACDHREGGEKALPDQPHRRTSPSSCEGLTGGHRLPTVSLTGGHQRPPVEISQADIQGQNRKRKIPHTPLKKTSSSPPLRSEKKKKPENTCELFFELAPEVPDPMAGFETLWASWPKEIRVSSNKKVARQRWAAQRGRYREDEILGAAEAYLRRTRPRDIAAGPWKPRTCYVEVFLNGKLEAAIEDFRESANRPRERIWSSALNDWVLE